MITTCVVLAAVAALVNFGPWGNDLMPHVRERALDRTYLCARWIERGGTVAETRVDLSPRGLD